MADLKFKARTGSQISDKEAGKYGPELLKIREQHGKVTPDLVVESAALKKSPLHPFFEWDDSRAAGHYRRYQARNLIRSIMIVVEDASKPEPVNLFFSVKNGDGRKYVTGFDVMSNTEYKQQLIEEALNDIKALEIKYKQLVELREIFAAASEQIQKKLDLKDELRSGTTS